jgi:hypothetical protein
VLLKTSKENQHKKLLDSNLLGEQNASKGKASKLCCMEEFVFVYGWYTITYLLEYVLPFVTSRAL